MNSRLLTLQDLECCLQIWQAITENSQNPLGATWSQAQIEAELRTQACWGLWVQQSDTPRAQVDEAAAATAHKYHGAHERLVGFCLNRAMPDGLEILLIAVDPLYQKQGCGRALLRELFSRLNPGDVVWLEVHEKNQKAIRFYEANGFRNVGRRGSYYSDQKAALLYEYTKKS